MLILLLVIRVVSIGCLVRLIGELSRWLLLLMCWCLC